MFSKISQKTQENICAYSLQLYYERSSHAYFPVNLAELLRTPLFTDIYLQATASASYFFVLEVVSSDDSGDQF